MRNLVEHFAYIFFNDMFFNKQQLLFCNGCQESIFGDFQSHRLENESIWVVFRVEFDGDIRLCVAPPKSMFLMMFLDIFEVLNFRDFFVFQIFHEIPDFFFPPRRRQAIPAAAAAAVAAVVVAAAENGKTGRSEMRNKHFEELV